MDRVLVTKYSAPVPRYTSYPTAPHFKPAIDHRQYAEWLAELPTDAHLSLYAHVPFCRALCWYCGCNTKGTRRYEPVQAYVRTLLAEISNVSSIIGRARRIGHVHWGGGSPNILEPGDIVKLGKAMRAYFNIADDAEVAVEIDPRFLTADQVEAFHQVGVNRVSFGVQDFDETVQRAINRLQSYAMTAEAVRLFRSRGITAVNIDLVYGLPHQTIESLERTIEQVVSLAPDRIAIFGYAHLPERLRQQRLIDSAAIPGAMARFDQAGRLADILAMRGYVRVGLDHFARPDDPIAKAGVRRNFQGYTTDQTDALIGLGASAIGRLPQGYVQNATATGEYIRCIRENGLATARGIRLSEDDRVRSHVIERLMCDLEFDGRELTAAFGSGAQPVLDDARAIVGDLEDGLVERTSDGFRVTPDGRPFLRSICARFDTYLSGGSARHSTGV